MRGKTKSLFSLNFFSKNSRCSCECPINLHFNLLAVYPRSVGGLEGCLRPAVWGMKLWKRAHDGNEFKSNLFSIAQNPHTSFPCCQKRWWHARLLRLLHFVMTVLFLARVPDLHLHSDTVKFSPWAITFFFVLRRGNLTEEKEPASFKLSTKSKLYVHDMSEAMLTALCVCSASAKPIVVFLSFPSFTLFPSS